MNGVEEGTNQTGPFLTQVLSDLLFTPCVALAGLTFSLASCLFCHMKGLECMFTFSI